MKKLSFAEKNPHLVAQWDFDRNTLSPYEVTPCSQKKAFWCCGVADDHKWCAPISERTRGRGCPCCCGKKVVPSNCLANTRPELLSEWDYERNVDSPFDVSTFSHQIVWWKCDVAEDHRWQASIGQRSRGRGCPCCVGKKVVPSNCLATTHPDLVKQWDYEKNTLSPYDVTHGSNNHIYWRCDVAEDHRWVATIVDRSVGYGCPCCVNQKVVPSNCLANTHPELAAQWDHEKNNISPYDVTYGTTQKVWWRCDAAEDHRWEATILSRSQGNGCPRCRKSKGEKAIDAALQANGCLFRREHKFPICKNLRSLPFDFVVGLPSQQPRVGVIEFHGQQHYESIKYYGGDSAFQLRVERDKIKADFCKSKNIPLLTIPYWEQDNISIHVHNFVNVSPPIVPDFGVTPPSEPGMDSGQ